MNTSRVLEQTFSHKGLEMTSNHPDEGKPCDAHPWETLDDMGCCPACEEPYEYFGKDEG